MSITIKNIFGNSIYTSSTATIIREAVEEAVTKKINLNSANLQGADLRDADLRKVYLDKADLREANLEGAYLQETDLCGANLQGANLYGANLQDADLKDADFSYADLRGANLQIANLEGSNLQLVNLQGANLHNANLQDCNLTNTNLQDCNLTNTNLQGANLYGANLTNAKNWQETEWARQSKQNLRYILNYQPKNEIEGLKDKLINGKINGTQYEGECCCLIGTLGNDVSCIPDYTKGLHNYSEQLFHQIKEGDTPDNNQFAKLALGVINEYL